MENFPFTPAGLSSHGLGKVGVGVEKCIAFTLWAKKKTHLKSFQQNPDFDEISQLPNHNLMFCDESGLNLHSSVRGYGWAPSGQRASTVVESNRGTNLSVIVATISF